ncbi:hypothetical protein RFI_07230 [Reticulomyxa filosa]|uniref:Uncharacterized protein n=1 Tax=Reticulomyxa filosa TaxID=46433 RepID=X6NVQ5_RETFI|nr:hypothetical protein RFI_07230 [Reticulomyxa filosa]|eukprot:ETO29889.1 hypothetical protein RFI_07230 [Reticulomyxa filosa]
MKDKEKKEDIAQANKSKPGGEDIDSEEKKIKVIEQHSNIAVDFIFETFRSSKLINTFTEHTDLTKRLVFGISNIINNYKYSMAHRRYLLHTFSSFNGSRYSCSGSNDFTIYGILKHPNHYMFSIDMKIMFGVLIFHHYNNNNKMNNYIISFSHFIQHFCYELFENICFFDCSDILTNLLLFNNANYTNLLRLFDKKDFAKKTTFEKYLFYKIFFLMKDVLAFILEAVFCQFMYTQQEMFQKIVSKSVL